MKQYKKNILCVFCFILLMSVTGCVSEFGRKIIPPANLKQDTNGVLREVQWQLEAFKYQGGWVSNFETERISIVFKRGTQVNGFSGCNIFSAEYKKTDNLLSVSSVLTTRKMCQSRSDVVMQTEANFLTNIKKVATYTVNHESLILFNEPGKRILVFKRKEK